jgi:hypothetical protein
MRTKNNLLAIVVITLVCVIAILFSGSIQGSQKTYEIQPNLSIPEYKTDMVRAIEAYERLMDRYMDLTGSHLTTVGMDLRNIVTKLDSIDGRLTELSARLTKIERALSIDNESDLVGKDFKSVSDYPKNTHREIQ